MVSRRRPTFNLRTLAIAALIPSTMWSTGKGSPQSRVATKKSAGWEFRYEDVGNGTTDSEGVSDSPSLSADGNLLAFISSLRSIVPTDSNALADVFVRDLRTGQVERISRALDPKNDVDGPSDSVDISADGRFVVFSSKASNLVEGDTNGVTDVFLHDRVTRRTRRVSLAADGKQANGASSYAAISGDGRVIVFASVATNLVAGDTNNGIDVFAVKLDAPGIERVSVGSDEVQGDRDSVAPSTSYDGTLVAFTSYARNFAQNDKNNGPDVFLRNRRTKTTELVSRIPAGTPGVTASQSGKIQSDGRSVYFSSDASDLVQGSPADMSTVPFRYDVRSRKVTPLLSKTVVPFPEGPVSRPVPLPDGRAVVFRAQAEDLFQGSTDAVGAILIWRKKSPKPELLWMSGTGGIVAVNPTNMVVDRKLTRVCFVAQVADPAGRKEMIGGKPNGFQKFADRIICGSRKG